MTGIVQPEPFVRLIAALEPWLHHIVIVGGWAHRLDRLHPHAQHLDYPPLSTFDTDVAPPPQLPAGERDIRARLLQRGFTEELFGGDHPPATHYALGGEDSGFYAEFLTPLVGAELDRKQKRKATTEVAGVISQRLRYIEILLDHPWSVQIAADGFSANIQIANPASYLAQKILILERRDREDRAKDILYMHDTLEVFGGRLPELSALWQRVSPKLSRRASHTVETAFNALFGAITDDIRRAAEISSDRAQSAQDIRTACSYGLAQVFGPPH